MKHIATETTQKLHEYIEDLINASNIKQKDMAEELGFDNQNIISMFKQGKTKIPLKKIPDFARIFRIDKKALLRRAMKEYQPELLEVVEENFGDAITKNEKAILTELRKLTDNSDPALISIRQQEALENFVNTLLS